MSASASIDSALSNGPGLAPPLVAAGERVRVPTPGLTGLFMGVSVPVMLGPGRRTPSRGPIDNGPWSTPIGPKARSIDLDQTGPLESSRLADRRREQVRCAGPRRRSAQAQDLIWINPSSAFPGSNFHAT